MEHLAKYPSDDGFKNKIASTSTTGAGNGNVVAVSNSTGASNSSNANLLGSHIMGSIKVNSNQKFLSVDYSNILKYGINSDSDRRDETTGIGSGIKKFKSPGSLSKSGNMEYVKLDDDNGNYVVEFCVL